MTKAFPGIIVKKPDNETAAPAPGMRPVRPMNEGKSWREASGQRRVFGAPKGGWPKLKSKEEAMQGEQIPRGDEEPRPKGYIFLCFTCSKEAGWADLFNGSVTMLRKCDNCKEGPKSTMQAEEARYGALVSTRGTEAPTGG